MKKLIFLLTSILLISSCSKDDENVKPIEEQVVANFATIVLASYEDAITGANNLKTAVDAFVKAPSAAGLEACKKAWIDSRPAYLQTEAYRFYNGPIDNDLTGVEGLINAWPVDETFIDYVQGNASAGVINDLTNYPTISKDILIADNEKGGETDVKVGYHAIEFLLWGQDFYDDSPGKRPYTDYVVGTGGTASNQARRAKYLQVVTDLLIETLGSVKSQWEEKGAYRVEFVKSANAKASLALMLIGMGKLTKGELSGERMTVPMESKEQEDEHSCFSDNTTNDFIYNEQGIYNVYIGKYTRTNGTIIDGAGIDDLVKAKDAATNKDMIAKLDASVAGIKAIPAPFDQAIVNSTAKIQTAIKALRVQTDELVLAASKIGININIPESN